MRGMRRLSLLFILVLGVAARGDKPAQNWTHYVRIGAYGLRSDNAESIVRDAQANHVFGIEVDNDIPGRYESFLDPTEKLNAHSRRRGASAQSRQQGVRLHRRDRVHHRSRRQIPAYPGQRSSGLAATKNYRRACRVHLWRGILDQAGR